MENLRVLEGSEVFFRGLQLPDHRFKSVSRLCNEKPLQFVTVFLYVYLSGTLAFAVPSAFLMYFF